MSSINTNVRPPRTVVVKVPGPQGAAGTTNLGTVTVVNPDQSPAITASGTARDRVYNFNLPRAAVPSVGTTTTLDPDENPIVNTTVTNGDVAYNFSLPRAAAFTVGDNTVDPNVAPSVSDVVTDGDVAITFGLPRAATLAVGTVTPVNPDVAPDVTTNVDGSGDVTFDFNLPEAPEFTLGAVTVLNPGQNPDVAFTVTDGDVEVDFDLPRAAAFSVDLVNVVDPDQSPTVVLTPDNGDYDIGFSLPRAPVVTVDTPATVLNPDQQPAVSSTTTDGDVEIAFDLPRAPAVTLGAITVVNPDENPDVSDSGTDGDVVLDIDLPRAPTFAIGTVGTVGPSDPADATDVGADGDIVIDFNLPRGEKGWSPTFALIVDGARRVLRVDDWVGGEGTKPATGNYVGAFGLVSNIEDAVNIRGEQGPAGIGSLNDILDVDIEDATDGEFIRYDDNSNNWVNVAVDTDSVPEGLANLYYTDARADDRADGRIAVASITDLSDVDEGSGFIDGDILVYDATFDAWVPGAAELVALADVDVSGGLNDGDALLYSAGDGDWKPGQAGPAFTTAASNTVAIDFSSDSIVTRSATDDVAFTGINYTAGKSATVRIVADASDRDFTFPSDWKFVSFKPAGITAGKTGVLTATAFGTSEADVVAAYAVEA